MSIEHKKSLPLALMAFGVMLAISPFAGAGGEMTAADVLALLPTGPDMHDLREKENLAKLIDQGEAAFPGLLDIIRTDNSPYVAGRALAVLRCSKNASPEARREVVTELGKVLGERKSMVGYANEIMLVDLARAIADMGEVGDAMLLLPLLDHPSGDVRSAGNSGMEKLTAKAFDPDAPAVEEQAARPEEGEGSDAEAETPP